MTNRRDFLRSAAVTGAAALVPAGEALHAGRDASLNPPGQAAQATAPVAPREVDPSDGGEVITTDRPGGDFMVAYDFKSDGTKLTGTTTSPDGATVAIKDGKIDGNKIAFSVSLDVGGMVLDLAYTGVVTPEEIKLTLDFAGMPFEYSVKKAK